MGGPARGGSVTKSGEVGSVSPVNEEETNSTPEAKLTPKEFYINQCQLRVVLEAHPSGKLMDRVPKLEEKKSAWAKEPSRTIVVSANIKTSLQKKKANKCGPMNFGALQFWYLFASMSRGVLVKIVPKVKMLTILD
ncbi:hypothetical protein F511_20540 [Dorcoceras hygrometricum]|uniref:Uncharacterized protein n=1 Tax=Dorcoceras hygrometricum TaxID=472368 RepID=A0A2Z7CLI3_9LAMI|nr:hypothetical protein F511_20540 [Dorcoceras hygrometricum]